VTPRRYRRKPIEVEAVQYDGSNVQAVVTFCNRDGQRNVMITRPPFVFASGHGWVYLDVGYYVFWRSPALHPDVLPAAEFEATYEPVEEPAAADGKTHGKTHMEWCASCQVWHVAAWPATGMTRIPECTLERRLLGIDAAGAPLEEEKA
jgi:hypothetical protein